MQCNSSSENQNLIYTAGRIMVWLSDMLSMSDRAIPMRMFVMSERY